MDKLALGEEEEEEVMTEGEVAVEAAQPLRLVGRFLTDKSVRVHVMKDRMADIWRPGKGVVIEEVESGLFVFEFFHQLDIQRILKQGPWSFDKHLLVLGYLLEGVSPDTVPLNKVPFWVQVHDVPTGFMAESVGRSLGNFIGEFLEYDAKNSPNFWRPIMRIRVLIDVRSPLKRSKKIKKPGGEAKTVTFKYERLEEFCYLCGRLGHVETFCSELFNMGADDGFRGWGPEQKADNRRGGGAGVPKSRYRREKGQEDWVGPFEKFNAGDSHNYSLGTKGKDGGKGGASNQNAATGGSGGNNDCRKGKVSGAEISADNAAAIFKEPHLFFPVKNNTPSTGGPEAVSKNSELMETEVMIESERKKRFREGSEGSDVTAENNNSGTTGAETTNNSDIFNNSFLSVGPGRQACREQ